MGEKEIASRFLCTLLLSLVCSQAFGADFKIDDLNALTNDAANSLIRTVGIGADHKAYRPASPLGAAIGIDIGLEVTAIQVPKNFESAIGAVSTQEKAPAFVPIPRLNGHKGLPLGFDVGISWVGFRQQKIIGGDIQWSLVHESKKQIWSGIRIPNLAIRYSQSYAKLWFIRTRTQSVDLVVSQNIAGFVNPYVTFGYQTGEGDLDVIVNQVPLHIKTNHKYSAFRTIVGMPLNLVIITATLEAAFSFTGVTTYGVKGGFVL